MTSILTGGPKRARRSRSRRLLRLPTPPSCGGGGRWTRMRPVSQPSHHPSLRRRVVSPLLWAATEQRVACVSARRASGGVGWTSVPRTARRRAGRSPGVAGGNRATQANRLRYVESSPIEAPGLTTDRRGRRFRIRRRAGRRLRRGRSGRPTTPGPPWEGCRGLRGGRRRRRRAHGGCRRGRRGAGSPP